MDTFQIHNRLKKLNIYRGIFPSDKIPKSRPIRPSLYIINIDDSQSPGSHWISIFFSKELHCGEIFDSLNLDFLFLPHCVQMVLQKYMSKRMLYVSKRVQSLESNFCGKYVIMYAQLKNKNISLKKIMSLFCNASNVNDSIISKCIN